MLSSITDAASWLRGPAAPSDSRSSPRAARRALLAPLARREGRALARTRERAQHCARLEEQRVRIASEESETLSCLCNSSLIFILINISECRSHGRSYIRNW